MSKLVHRALKICSKSKLKEEINRIKEILLDNGYPEDFVLKQISKKITQFSRPKRFGPDKCPVYLRVTYTGKAALTLKRNLRIAVENCYGSVALRTVSVSRQMLPASRKDALPAIQMSSVSYEYKCHCDRRYVGRTAQQLQDRMKQHVPKWLRQHTAYQRVQPNRACKRKQPTPECDSAIGQHLLENDQCGANYNDDQFAILDTARSPFLLSLLEASYSYIKVRRPNLCKQKEFVYVLKLFK